jgi:hypothetical protein
MTGAGCRPTWPARSPTAARLEALAARAEQQDAAEGNSRGSRSSCFITVTLWPGRPSRMRDRFRRRAGLPGWPARPSRAGDLRWAFRAGRGHRNG